MANLSNIARPYARGAFDCAREKDQLAEWKAFLTSAAYMAKQPGVIRLLEDPEILSSQHAEFFSDVLASQLNKEQKDFVKLLAQNRRLVVLPEISDMFDAYYAALEKISHVRIVTATKAETNFLDNLKTSLTERMKRTVMLDNEINPAILGGAIIHMGDKVIDASIRGKLNRLLEFLLR